MGRRAVKFTDGVTKFISEMAIKPFKDKPNKATPDSKEPPPPPPKIEDGNIDKECTQGALLCSLRRGAQQSSETNNAISDTGQCTSSGFALIDILGEAFTTCASRGELPVVFRGKGKDEKAIELPAPRKAQAVIDSPDLNAQAKIDQLGVMCATDDAIRPWCEKVEGFQFINKKGEVITRRKTKFSFGRFKVDTGESSCDTSIGLGGCMSRGLERLKNAKK